MPEVGLERLCKTYAKGVRALKDVTLTVASGEWLVLVGPSGCGKTTLLRLIAGLETPSGGTIRIAGRLVNDIAPSERDVAMVFQRPALFPNRSVRGNLGFGMELRRSGFFGQRETPAEAATIRETAALLGIEGLLDRYPGELSGGEQQRVALGRALASKRGLMLLDEPFGHLDAPLRWKFLSELPLLRRQFPTTMVLVTHDPAEALTLGDRIGVLQDGSLQQLGRPDEIRQCPVNAFVADLFREWGIRS